MNQNKCIYCTFDPVTHMGADFISGKPINKKFKKKIDSWDGMDWEYATYIYTDKKSFTLEQMSQIVNAMNVNIRILLLITVRNVGEG